jgi:hypothetical protein
MFQAIPRRIFFHEDKTGNYRSSAAVAHWHTGGVQLRQGGWNQAGQEPYPTTLLLPIPFAAPAPPALALPLYGNDMLAPAPKPFPFNPIIPAKSQNDNVFIQMYLF